MDYEGGEGPWGTYYGPMMVRRKNDGQQISIPSLEQINPTVIAYWEERARSAKNPLLRCRYADLSMLRGQTDFLVDSLN
jgi:hypothetical protein